MTEPSRRKIAGSTEVSEDVICDMVGYAALGSYGVVGMSAPKTWNGFTRMLHIHRLRRGIDLRNEDGAVSVDLHVVIEHGTNLNAVSENLAHSVRYVLSEYAQLPVKDVSIHIEGIKVR